jgi:hypothetical protein
MTGRKKKNMNEKILEFSGKYFHDDLRILQIWKWLMFLFKKKKLCFIGVKTPITKQESGQIDSKSENLSWNRGHYDLESNDFMVF